MLGENAVTTVSSSTLIPVNGWVAGDCQGITWVWAGRAARRPESGLLVLERSRGTVNRRTLYINVPESGAIKITDAPIGPKVVTSAQRRGKLDFKGRGGASGTLDLSDDTATLSTGEVIEATEDPFPRAG